MTGAFGAVLLLLSAVAASDRTTRVPDAACGLTVEVPAGFEARPDRDRIDLRPIGWERRRSISGIGLTFGRGEPSAALPEIRKLGSSVARYRLTREAGGSGGEESTLVAERSVAGGVIRLEAWMQRDDGARPDFGPAWLAFAAARCTVPASR